MKERNYIYLLLLCLIIGVFAVEMINFQRPEVIYNGYDNFVKQKILENCDTEQIPYSRNIPAWWLVCVSENHLGNARIIPFVTSMGIIPLVFLLSKEITKDRRISILSAMLMGINPIFLIFNDSSAFHQFWAVALLGAIYMTYKKPILSIPLFAFAVITKPMALLFIPVMLMLTIKSRKIFYLHMMLSSMFVIVSLSMDTIIQTKTVLFLPTSESVASGLHNVYWNLTKHLSVAFIPVLGFALFHKNKLVHFLIISSIVEIATLPMFTIYTTFPYRLVPLMAFVSIGISLSAKNIWDYRQKKLIAKQSIKSYGRV